jgi:lysophospholipase L1-like esterase
MTLRLLGHRGAPERLIDHVYPVDDPVLDWRNVPGSVLREGKVVYRYNSAGFRDIEHSVAKPVGVRRIVVVGDSVTEGAGVPWESTFTGLLQARLQGEYQGEYEVVNLAQSGMNTPQEVHLLEQDGIAYAPDLVVINFVLNDCDFFTQLAPAQRYYEESGSKIGLLFNMPIAPRLKQALKSSAVLYFMKERGEELKGRIFGSSEGDYFERIWGSDENRTKITTGFDRLVALRAQHGFDVIVIIWPLVTEYDPYRYRPLHAWVRGVAEERGLPVLDLLPNYTSFSFRELQVAAEDHVHPNDRGHRIAADAFLMWFRTSWQRSAAVSSE